MVELIQNLLVRRSSSCVGVVRFAGEVTAILRSSSPLDDDEATIFCCPVLGPGG